MATKNLSEYNLEKVPDASNMIFGIVVAEWNPEITGALLNGCVSTLERHGALPENIHVKTVPGSFELIYGAHQMTLNDGYDAVIILGSVIRGETPHFDYICQGVTAGIARLNATSSIPVVYGLLTTENLQQAQDRSGGRLGRWLSSKHKNPASQQRDFLFHARSFRKSLLYPLCNVNDFVTFKRKLSIINCQLSIKIRIFAELIYFANK